MSRKERCFNCQNKINDAPWDIKQGAGLCFYGQRCKAAVTPLELYLCQMSLSEMRIGCLIQNGGIPQKLRATHLPKSWEEAFGGLPGFEFTSCRVSHTIEALESSSQGWTKSIFGLTFRHPGKTEDAVTEHVMREIHWGQVNRCNDKGRKYLRAVSHLHINLWAICYFWGLNISRTINK